MCECFKMRTTIRNYVKGSIFDHLKEYNLKPTHKVEMVKRKTDDELIAEELVKAERAKKEMELLEAQLKLPPSKRSEELMRKYNLSVASDNSLIDNYNQDPNQRVSYEIYYPEDIAVKQLRPSNHLVAIEKVLDSSGDEFNFYFHVSISEPTPGTFNYKVDGMDTYVDREYKLLSKGDFDLYKALYFYKMKDNSYSDQIMKVFKKYGIIPNDSKTLFGQGSQVNLKIRGLGLRVTYTTLNAPIKQEPVVIEDEPIVEPLLDPPALEESEESSEEEFLVSPSLDTNIPDNVKKFLKDESRLTVGIPFKLKGQDNPILYKDKVLSIENIYIGKQYTKETKKNIEDGRLITGPNSYMVIGSTYSFKGGWGDLNPAIAASNLEFSIDNSKRNVTNEVLMNFFKHLAKKSKK